MLPHPLALLVWLFSAFAAPLEPARTDPAADPTDAELAAAERMDSQSCKLGLGLVFPGVAQACTARPAEAAFLASLTVGEIAATGVILNRVEPTDPALQPGRSVTLVALQDLWVYSISRAAVDISLSRRQLYAPPDELPEMLAAPFDPRVLRRPAVFGGILVLAGAGTALQYALDPPLRFGGRPNIWGARPPEAVGYPLAAGLHGVLMSHVAVAEEIAFRGLVQSGAARATSELGGFAIGTAVFGPFHALNALVLPEEERLSYLAIGVPWITLTGSWLGLVYMWGDYRLGGPIAVHWWYNMLISAAAFAANPEDNLFRANIRLQW